MSYRLVETREGPVTIQPLLDAGYFYGGYGNGFKDAYGRYVHLYCSPGQTQSQCQLAAIAGTNYSPPPSPNGGGATTIDVPQPVLLPAPDASPQPAAPGGGGCASCGKGGGAGPVTTPGQPGPTAPTAGAAPMPATTVTRDGLSWWVYVMAAVAIAQTVRNG